MSTCFECKPEYMEDEPCEVPRFADDIMDSQSKSALEVHRRLDDLRQTSLLCDGKVISGNKSFPVHKSLLAAESPYFR